MILSADLIHNTFLFFFIATISIKLFLLILNITHIKQNLQNAPEQFRKFISQEEHQKAQNYTLEKNYFSIFTILLHAVILLVWLETPLLNNFTNYIESFGYPMVWTGVIYLFVFSIISSILSIPETLYSTFVIEEKYGFNKTTAKIYFTDLIKQFIISAIIGLPVIYVILKLLYSLGDFWWFYSWLFIMIFQFIMIWAYPKFIAPLFNKFTELDDEELTIQIKSLSEKCKVDFKDYYVMNASMRSSHGNAYFTGFGKNKRIVFFDTLLKTLEKSEVISVLAHELGHFKKKHILKMIITSAITLLIGLWVLGNVYNNPEFFKAFNIESTQAHTALLLFMLIIPYYTFLMTPFSSYMSRKKEFEADEFAATHASAKELISALLKMYKDNSSSLTPHPWYSKFYFSHPPAKERVEFLEQF